MIVWTILSALSGMPHSVNVRHQNLTITKMTQSIETLINQLANLVYDGWQGDAREISIDYAYLLTEGGERDLLLQRIDEFKAMHEEHFGSDKVEDDDEDCDDDDFA
jgi:hypothetical protein